MARRLPGYLEMGIERQFGITRDLGCMQKGKSLLWS